MEWGFLACFCRFVISQTSGLVFWADMAEDYSFKKGNILHTAQAQYKNVSMKIMFRTLGAFIVFVQWCRTVVFLW